LDLREAVETVAVEYPRYGSRRITAELGRRGWQVNRKHIQRVMREENLLVAVRRYCRTMVLTLKHPGQSLGHLLFITLITVKELGVKPSFPIARNLKVFDLP
jgi:hypothetical protein